MVNCQASVGAATSADAVRLADASARDDKRQPVLVEDDQTVPASACELLTNARSCMASCALCDLTLAANGMSATPTCPASPLA